jgi:peptidoglycan/xylan/chitin deacetylase (PgdA/CDA1 family)
VTWLPILAYHRVVPCLPEQDRAGNCISAARFERQLRWLSRFGYQSVPLSKVGPAIGDVPECEASLPRRPVVITFDDGYRDNYLYAWPLLMRYGFTATIFVVSDAIGRDNSFDSYYAGPPVRMLGKTQIQEMHRYGIDFGSHSCTHPPSLADLPAPALTRELEVSRSSLEDVVGAPVEHFSYPYSRLDTRVEEAVERAGYRLACAGTGTRFSRFRLHRVSPQSRGGAALELQIGWRHAKHLVKVGVLGPTLRFATGF